MSHQTIASALNNRVITFVSIDTEYNCAICMQIADEPVRCSGMCAGIFCNGCMTLALARSRSCPLCTKTNITAFKDVVLRNQIMKHEVNCVNKGQAIVATTTTRKRKANPNDKCTWTGRYDELAAHLNHCDFEKLVCTNEGCEEIVERHELQDHQRVCMHRTIPCELCAEVTKVSEMAAHLEICPSVEETCQCGSRGTRLLIAEHKRIDCLLTEIICEVVGCGTKVIRQDYEKHQDDAAKYHVRLLSSKVALLENIVVTSQIKWRIKNVATSLAPSPVPGGIRTLESPSFSVFYRGTHKLVIGANVQNKRLSLMLTKDVEFDEGRLDVGGTSVTITKNEMPDIKKTLERKQFLENSNSWCVSFGCILEDFTPYIDNNGINVSLDFNLNKDDQPIVL